MKLIVYRGQSGNVINIGEWDYMITIDENGLEITNNPLPDAATSEIEEV